MHGPGKYSTIVAIPKPKTPTHKTKGRIIMVVVMKLTWLAMGTNILKLIVQTRLVLFNSR